MSSCDGSFKDFVTYKVTVNLDVLRTFMSTGLAAMESATWLSLLIIAGERSSNPISFNNDDSHVTSQQVWAIARYSASAVERATTDCFLVFQEIGEEPRRTQYHVVDFLVVGQLAQSLSQYAVSWAADEDASKIPWPGLFSR